MVYYEGNWQTWLVLVVVQLEGPAPPPGSIMTRPANREVEPVAPAGASPHSSLCCGRVWRFWLSDSSESSMGWMYEDNLKDYVGSSPSQEEFRTPQHPLIPQ